MLICDVHMGTTDSQGECGESASYGSTWYVERMPAADVCGRLRRKPRVLIGPLREENAIGRKSAIREPVHKP